MPESDITGTAVRCRTQTVRGEAVDTTVGEVLVQPNCHSMGVAGALSPQPPAKARRPTVSSLDRTPACAVRRPGKGLPRVSAPVQAAARAMDHR